MVFSPLIQIQYLLLIFVSSFYFIWQWAFTRSKLSHVLPSVSSDWTQPKLTYTWVVKMEPSLPTFISGITSFICKAFTSVCKRKTMIIQIRICYLEILIHSTIVMSHVVWLLVYYYCIDVGKVTALAIAEFCDSLVNPRNNSVLKGWEYLLSNFIIEKEELFGLGSGWGGGERSHSVMEGL